METKNMMWGVMAVLLIAVLFTSFIGPAITGRAASTVASGGKLDTSGWTENEKMNYEMHGTIPARVKSSASSSSGSGMVGGC